MDVRSYTTKEEGFSNTETIEMLSKLQIICDTGEAMISVTHNAAGAVPSGLFSISSNCSKPWRNLGSPVLVHRSTDYVNYDNFPASENLEALVGVTVDCGGIGVVSTIQVDTDDASGTWRYLYTCLKVPPETLSCEELTGDVVMGEQFHLTSLAYHTATCANNSFIANYGFALNANSLLRLDWTCCQVTSLRSWPHSES